MNIRYHVGMNEIGLAPQYRVECLGDLDNARAWLTADIENTTEDIEDDSEFDALLCRLAEMPDAEIVGEHRVDAFVFWVRAVESCGCPCECAEEGRDDCDGKHGREAAAEPQGVGPEAPAEMPTEAPAQAPTGGSPKFATLDDVAAIMASRPTDESMLPLPVDTTLARIVTAQSVTEGDWIIAGVDRCGADYRPDWFCEAYEAHPQPFHVFCDCGVCELCDPADGDHVVLTSEATNGPWLSCDPWPADRLVLIAPAQPST